MHDLKEQDTRATIEKRAYEIYQQRGATPGRELDDWLTAEREIARERSRAESIEAPRVRAAVAGRSLDNAR